MTDFRTRKDDGSVFPLSPEVTLESFFNAAKNDEARIRAMKHESVSLGAGAINMPGGNAVRPSPDQEKEMRERLSAFLDKIRGADREWLDGALRYIDDDLLAKGKISAPNAEIIKKFIRERRDLLLAKEGREQRTIKVRGDLPDIIDSRHQEMLDADAVKHQGRDDPDDNLLTPGLFRTIHQLELPSLEYIKEGLKTVTADSNGELAGWFGLAGWHDVGMSADVKRAFLKVLDRRINLKQLEKETKYRGSMAHLPDELNHETAKGKELLAKIEKLTDPEVGYEMRRSLPQLPRGLSSKVLDALGKKTAELNDAIYKAKEAKKQDLSAKLAAGKLPIDVNNGEYVRAINDADTAVAAKFLKKHLSQEFPGVKFEVKTKRYSGGSNISVHYTGGPPEEKVEKIVDAYHEDRGSDPQTDYYNVNRYMHLTRHYPKDTIEQVKKEVEKEFGKPYHWRETDMNAEIRQRLRALNLPGGNPKEGSSF